MFVFGLGTGELTRIYIYKLINRRKINIRFGIQVIQKATSVFLVKYTREPPWLVVEWLHILDLHEQNIPRFRSFDLKGASEIVYSCKIDILDVVGRVIILNLATGPIDTFDLDYLIIGDGATDRDYLRSAFFVTNNTARKIPRDG
jgi:hypothetical protein